VRAHDVLVELDSSPRNTVVSTPSAGKCLTPCTLIVPPGTHVFHFARDGRQRDYEVQVDEAKRIWVSLQE
jgi:hypothetical protein